MIIQSFLDTDFYKYSMGQAVLHNFPTAMVKYQFKCRNKDINFTPYLNEIQSEIESLCTLQITNEELSYLKTIPFLKPSFIEFLRGIRLNKDFIKIFNNNGDLNIEIQGPWFSTIWFEVPVLSIVNEVYFKQFGEEPNILQHAREKLYKKIAYLKDNVDSSFKLADF
jgi:nicotinate phosphoribosyltransferase